MRLLFDLSIEIHLFIHLFTIFVYFIHIDRIIHCGLICSVMLFLPLFRFRTLVSEVRKDTALGS